MAQGSYFIKRKSTMATLVKVFLALLVVFSIVFFLWCLMRYNKIMDEKAEKEQYIEELNDEISELQHFVDMPLDDAYKIRIARERLGMCFPDEIIYYTDME